MEDYKEINLLFEDIKPGDIFITDYNANIIVLPTEIEPTGKIERWFTSFDIIPNHYDIKLEGKLAYKTSAAPGSGGKGELTVVNKEHFYTHLRHYFSRKEDNPDFSRKLADEALENTKSKMIGITIDMYDILNFADVCDSIERLISKY